MKDLSFRAAEVLPAAGFGNFDAGVFLREGRGSRVWDESGREYVDYLIGSGPMILGHGHPEVLEAVREQLARGMTFFTNNLHGLELAEEIVRAVPCAEQVRFLSTGGEADMYAIRLARAATGRDLIVKFEGGYHGMSAEAQMSLAPTRQVNLPQPVPDSAGIPGTVAAGVLVAPFNDTAFLESLVAEHAGRIAAIIVEPLQRIIPPADGFLQGLRRICDRDGIVLIFDEIVTGFRLAYGGAQELYGVTPDLCTLGKIIGGGLPLAAIAGKSALMDHFDKARSPDRWLMMVGTLSGNPLAAVAGLKTLEILRRPGSYDILSRTGSRLQDMIGQHLDRAGVAHRILGHSSLFDVVFADRPLRDYRDMQAADAETAALFNSVLRDQSVLKSPGKIYVSLSLDAADLARTEEAIAAASEAVARPRG